MKTDFWQNHKWLMSFLVAIASIIVIALAICCLMFLQWLADVNVSAFTALTLVIIITITFRIILE